MDPERKKRLDEVALIAVRLEAETWLPAQMLIAQWAIESKWGEKPCGHANYFGIKKADRHTKYCTVATHEVVNGKEVLYDLEFADYDSLEESCRDYAWLITHAKPYAEAWSDYRSTRNIHQLAFAVSSVYATNLRYSQLMMQITGQANVREAIELARA